MANRFVSQRRCVNQILRCRQVIFEAQEVSVITEVTSPLICLLLKGITLPADSSSTRRGESCQYTQQACFSASVLTSHEQARASFELKAQAMKSAAFSVHAFELDGFNNSRDLIPQKL